MATILVIEPDVALAQRIAAPLLVAGYDLRCVREGIEGLALAQQHQPSLILLDRFLPTINSRALTTLLRTRLHVQPRVLVISAQHAHHAEVRGWDGVVPTPINSAALVLQVGALLPLARAIGA
jgi:DNA-binding response OmpR family regulator